jgi:hypothetical protein
MFHTIFLMVLYALLYIFILAVIYQKIRQGKKVHPIWFLVFTVRMYGDGTGKATTLSRQGRNTGRKQHPSIARQKSLPEGISG